MTPSPSPSPSVPTTTDSSFSLTSTSIIRHDLLLYVNGTRIYVPEKEINPSWTLLQFLRSTLHLTGTKLGCGEGGCGACTVMVSKFDMITNQVRHFSVNSCLTPVCAMDSCAITTVEGIGQITSVGHDAIGLHPAQQALAESHGSQCGYCTPGFIMALYTMVTQRASGQSKELTMADIEHGMDGNLCRCTGYRPILDAAKSFGDDAIASTCKGDCVGCPNKDQDIEDIGDGSIVQKTSCSSTKIRTYANQWKQQKPLKEPEFPFELKQKSIVPDYLQIQNKIQWFAPVTLQQLLLLKQQYPHAKISVGNTEMGIETKFKQFIYSPLIHVGHVAELNTIRLVSAQDLIHSSIGQTFDGIKIGGAVPLTQVQAYLSTLKTTQPSHASRSCTAIIQMLQWFASGHIRNVACLAGNLVTASPISDMNPLLSAMNAWIELQSTTGVRVVNVLSFFKSYRKVDIGPEEIITSVYVPFMKEYEFILPFKQAKRREDDISIVTAGIRMVLTPQQEPEASWMITDASLVYGGMAAITKAAVTTQQFLIGKCFNEATMNAACDVLHSKDFILPATVPGGMARYRESLCASFLFKFYISIAQSLQSLASIAPPPIITANEQSAGDTFVTSSREVSNGFQQYGVEKGGLTNSKHEPVSVETKRTPVGDALMHKSAYLQVTGEALYTDDIPETPDTLHAAFVLSTMAHAKIKLIDATEALGMQGVQQFFDASVFTTHHLGSNQMGPVVKDEECFAAEKVVCVGQPIGMIVAITHEIAMKAVEKVKIVYEELPSIITIQDAIAAKSFIGPVHELVTGNVDQGFAESDVVLEGECSMGGQEQFYFETNVALCTPHEGGLKIISSTQAATKTQVLVARALGMDENRISCTTKRIGGGFGGKETRSVFVAVATSICSYIMKKPVKCLLERHVDMLMTGGRHPFYSKYKVGIKKNGLIHALQVDLYNNAGYSLDLSQAVMDRALFHCENAYKIPNVHACGTVCRTNLPTNTAFRGFGGPQGLMVAETYIDHIARTLDRPPHDIRFLNMYRENDVTHFGQPLVDFHLCSLWEKTWQKSNFEAKQVEIQTFNQNNRWKKRGIAIIPTKFGISFTAKFMNQGGALVHVYADGSVLISHGGIEMGQGLHTKVIQVAAQAFGIPHTKVHIEETCTSKVANSQPSAASMSTDLYGMATLDACEQILLRLAPVRERLGGASVDFATVAHTAYMERIDLSAHGFYIVPHERCGYDWSKSVEENVAIGTAFNYFTTGVACTVVELDVLTGDYFMHSVDIMMDLGASINPGIDIGQIEGAFMQGFGLFTIEEHVWGDDSHPWVKRGHLFTRGPGAYKIPSANDVPLEFNVWLETNVKNRFAVHSSRAVGEPPLFLGSSAFFAAKEAIYAARNEVGFTEYFELKSPLTPERARMACQDPLLQKVFTARQETMKEYQPNGSF